MKQEWLKLYDPAYVEETLIQPLHKYLLFKQNIPYV